MRRLVSLLAAYIASGTARMGMHDEAVLAGGRSQMPGMGGALGSAMRRRIIAADDPAMGNAVGFEAKVSSTVAGLAGESSPKRVLELPLHLALGRLAVLRGGFLSGFRPDRRLARARQNPVRDPWDPVPCPGRTDVAPVFLAMRPTSFST